MKQTVAQVLLQTPQHWLSLSTAVGWKLSDSVRLTFTCTAGQLGTNHEADPEHRMCVVPAVADAGEGQWCQLCTASRYASSSPLVWAVFWGRKLGHPCFCTEVRVRKLFHGCHLPPATHQFAAFPLVAYYRTPILVAGVGYTTRWSHLLQCLACT